VSFEQTERKEIPNGISKTDYTTTCSTS
jgi:hypothetical protein